VKQLVTIIECGKCDEKSYIGPLYPFNGGKVIGVICHKCGNTQYNGSQAQFPFKSTFILKEVIMPDHQIAHRIAEARRAAGLTCSAMGDRLPMFGDLSPNQRKNKVNNWEHNMATPSEETISQLAVVLGVTAEWLKTGQLHGVEISLDMIQKLPDKAGTAEIKTQGSPVETEDKKSPAPIPLRLKEDAPAVKKPYVVWSRHFLEVSGDTQPLFTKTEYGSQEEIADDVLAGRLTAGHFFITRQPIPFRIALALEEAET
jgi:transcriptional regulator with XRE-family HTH domain